MYYKFVSGIPVIEGSEAEDFAKAFEETLKEKGLKCVNYRTGIGTRQWTLDLYVIPLDEEKPYFQKQVKGDHILSMDSGYFVKTKKNYIVQEVQDYMEKIV